MRARLVLMLAGLAIATAGAAWLGTELVMAPTGGERSRLIAMYGAIVVAVVVIGLALGGWAKGSVRRRLLAVGVAGPAIVGAVTMLGAWSMFISRHDTQFVVILVAAACVLAAGLAHVLGSPLLEDLDRIASTAHRLGRGELDARVSLDRPDELGELAGSFDAMADRIERSVADRQAAEADRQFMLSALVHDARTPLTAMKAAIEALQDGMAPNPDRYLESINAEVRAVNSILDNLHVLGRIDAAAIVIDPVPVDLVASVRGAADAIEPLAAKYRVSISIDGPDRAVAAGAEAETSRVINNLLSNAIRHAQHPGEVQVQISADSTEVSVQVIDDGPGLAADFIERAFEPFVRAGEARARIDGGAGLGLAVVKGLVEAQGGRVWAHPGPGGRVGFALPR